MKLDKKTLRDGLDRIRDRRAKGEIDPRQALHTRVQLAKLAAAKTDMSYVKLTPGGGVAACSCKLTGEWLHGLVEQDGYERREKRGRTQVIYKRVVHGYNQNFTMLRIQFDDGSAHDTPVSKNGLAMLRAMAPDDQIDTLEILYMQDVHQWLLEEARGMGLVANERMGARGPIGWEELELQPEDVEITEPVDEQEREDR